MDTENAPGVQGKNSGIVAVSCNSVAIGGNLCGAFYASGVDSLAIARLGLLLDYPRGTEDRLQVIGDSFEEWTDVPLSGRWFPDGFVGVMSNAQRFAAGEDERLISPVEDALETMRLVEACYVSDARGGVELNSLKTK